MSQPVRSPPTLNVEATPNMHFEAKKVIVVGGSTGIGRQVAIDVVDHGGSAVIVGRSKAHVDDSVADLTSRQGEAWGIAAELTDRAAIADVQRELSEHHNDPHCSSTRPDSSSRSRFSSTTRRPTTPTWSLTMPCSS